VVSLGRVVVTALLAALAPTVLVVEVFKLAVDPDVVVAVVTSLVGALVLVLILRLGCGKAGVDVLRDEVELLATLLRDAGDVSVLEGAVFVQSATHKVGTVRELGCPWSNLYATSLLPGSAALRRRSARGRGVRSVARHRHAWSALYGGGTRKLQDRGLSVSPQIQVASVIVIRVGEANLVIGMVTSGWAVVRPVARGVVVVVEVHIVDLVLFDFLVHIVVGILVVLVLFVLIIVRIRIIILLSLFLQSLVFSFLAQSADFVLLAQGVIDGEACRGFRVGVLADPILLLWLVACEFVESCWIAVECCWCWKTFWRMWGESLGCGGWLL
jgi:hypothetical protein